MTMTMPAVIGGTSIGSVISFDSVIVRLLSFSRPTRRVDVYAVRELTYSKSVLDVPGSLSVIPALVVVALWHLLILVSPQ
jgi:hypothetical protein